MTCGCCSGERRSDDRYPGRCQCRDAGGDGKGQHVHFWNDRRRSGSVGKARVCGVCSLHVRRMLRSSDNLYSTVVAPGCAGCLPSLHSSGCRLCRVPSFTPQQWLQVVPSANLHCTVVAPGCAGSPEGGPLWLTGAGFYMQGALPVANSQFSSTEGVQSIYTNNGKLPYGPRPLLIYRLTPE